MTTERLSGLRDEIEYSVGDGYFKCNDANQKPVGPYRRKELNAVLNATKNLALRILIKQMEKDIDNNNFKELKLSSLGKVNAKTRIAKFGDGANIFYVAIEDRRLVEGSATDDLEKACELVQISSGDIGWDDAEPAPSTLAR